MHLSRALLTVSLLALPALARPGDELVGRWIPDEKGKPLSLTIRRGAGGGLELERRLGESRRRPPWTSHRARVLAGKLWVEWSIPTRRGGRGAAGRLAGDESADDDRTPGPRAVYSRSGDRLLEWFPGRNGGTARRWRRAPPLDLPLDTAPPDRPGEWPHSLGSTRVLVHYREPAEEPEARRVLEILESSWDRQVKLGFRAPPSDGGSIGPDARLDAFLFKGVVECYCDARDAVAATPWDDQRVFLVIDPWGEYGGDELDATVAHELNHACQAADDWFEPAWIFESSATLIEKELHPEQVRWLEIVTDVQAHPEWGFGHDDGYETWFLYGQGLYLDLLRHRWAGGKLSFLGELWTAMRSPAGAEEDLSKNEPDVFDALEGWLRARGSSLHDSLREYARWRWYTGSRATGRHFPDAKTLPQVAVAARRRPLPGTIALAPEPLASQYVELFRAGQDDPRKVRVKVEGAPPAGGRWVLEALPGKDGADSEPLDPAGAVVELGKDGTRTLMLLALPPEGLDADGDPPGPCRATLRLERAE